MNKRAESNCRNAYKASLPHSPYSCASSDVVEGVVGGGGGAVMSGVVRQGVGSNITTLPAHTSNS